MATVVSFEAGTIADSLKKAARVAPAKVGSAFDKAAGIVFDVSPESEVPCVIRATDTAIFYMETLDVVKAEGAAVRWRLPSQLLGNVIGTVPAMPGKQVTFEQISATQVRISSGRMRVTLNLNANPYYPEWSPADNLKLTTAQNFGGNITRVEWAASKAGPPPMNGVLLDGEHIIATDRYRIARVPCAIELHDGPIVIPAFSIGQLLKQVGDIQVGMDDTLFVAMPDNYTQVKTVVFGGGYPPVERIINMPFDEEAKFKRSDLVEKIQKATYFAGADRAPIMQMFIGREELAVMMENADIGLFGDVIELPGQASHNRVKIRFSPDMILAALNNAPNETITFKYNPSATNRPVLLEGDSDYQAWIAPRSDKIPT